MIHPHRWLMLAAVLLFALPVAGAEEDPGYNPGPDSFYYQPRRNLMGYPPLEAVSPRPDLPLDHDPRRRLRFSDFVFGTVTAAQAEAKARWARDSGITMIAGQDNRYLFFEEGDTILPPSTSVRKTLDQIIADTKQVVEACHRHGVKYVHHLTSTMVTEDYWNRHPDFRSIDMRTGEPIKTQYRTAAVCVANPDWQQDLLSRLERLVRETGLDGLFVDELVFWRPTACGCASCRTRFKLETGFELPEKYDPAFIGKLHNPAYRRWLLWRQEKLIELNKKISAIARLNGGVRFEYCSTHSTTGSIYLTFGWSHDNPLHYVDLFGYEGQPQSYRELGAIYSWPIAIHETKLMRAISDHLGSTPWYLPYPKMEGDNTYLWMLAFVEGCATWWRDRRVDHWKPLALWEEVNEDLINNAVPLGNIGILMSVDSAIRNANQGDKSWATGISAFCAALTDSHLPYRAVLAADVESASLAEMGVDTLILPGSDTLSPRTIEAIRAFVSAGGTLIATGATALYDAETFEAGRNFALADVLGVSLLGLEDAGNFTLQISGSNEIIGDFTADLRREQPFCRVAPRGAQVLGRIIADRGGRFPGMTVNRFGEGRAIYFAGRPELGYHYSDADKNPIKTGQFWRDLRDDSVRELIARTVRAGPPPALIAANLPIGIVAEGYRQSFGGVSSVQVRLANFTGGVIREGNLPQIAYLSFPEVNAKLPDPSQPITLSVRAAAVEKVLMISPDYDAAVELPFHQDGDRARVELPTFHRAAAVCFIQSGSADVLARLEGKIAGEIPAPKQLVYTEHQPMVGPYHPDHLVIFADAKAMSGGRFVVPWKDEISRTIYGQEGEAQAAATRFQLDRVPEQVTLEIAGVDGLGHPNIQLQIQINGQTIFEGTSPYGGQWNAHPFPLDAKLLRVGENQIIIRNITAPQEGQPIAWMSIHFIRLLPH